jgi:hypothetical protein
LLELKCNLKIWNQYKIRIIDHDSWRRQDIFSLYQFLFSCKLYPEKFKIISSCIWNSSNLHFKFCFFLCSIYFFIKVLSQNCKKKRCTRNIRKKINKFFSEVMFKILILLQWKFWILSISPIILPWNKFSDSTVLTC